MSPLCPFLHPGRHRYGGQLSYVHLIETTRKWRDDKSWAMAGDTFEILNRYRRLYDGLPAASTRPVRMDVS